ncbi:MAG: acetylglutamate kinase [Candidatus Omnitrophica bacterium]|nr:acetylglutamate kinase [Candidatus Omnitrophota bacterium]
MQNIIKKAGVLVEAIPYIHAFRHKVFVIKYGGSILEDPVIRKNVLEDIVFLSYVGIKTILVHGGGPHISSRLKEIGVQPVFQDGIRVTDEPTLKIVTEELIKLNERIVKEIKELKGDVTGIIGNEDLVHVIKRQSAKDLGFVGTVTNINKDVLNTHLKRGHITVISPLGVGDSQQAYNVNADEVASAISKAMNAEKLVLLTDVSGVMRDMNDPDSLIPTLTLEEVQNLINTNVIKGGMIPKVNSCIEALNAGVKKVHIVDAQVEHALLLEFFTNQGIGTQILRDSM